ncbi:2-amino-4-hydroxy-6-hydroxymethyldihydropteridine diphosphokinase [Paracoccus ravus]|uniref:2-amino-4-hydroxy-6- hydroxymethyldihydropteridine diphosphokinase n=1 Tax=Paracoccus ravus TaxID=2447760 RepID=UPI00106DFB21|nr:2-amino-4-hydroxy-6-hydroxymethyldihydropteridine diphosphokinase [Paracoccus ravus]
MNENTSISEKSALVAIGGNLPSMAGNPEETLQLATRQIDLRSGMRVVSVSRFWRSPAFPLGSGPDYVNAAIQLQTELSPEGLLAALHEVEAALGRRREGGRWQSRGIDLDLIAYEDLVRPDAATQDEWRGLSLERQVVEAPETLVLPHPRMQDRGFVLLPLAEIAPGWRHPRLGKTVAELLAALPPAAKADIAPLTS